MKFIKLLSIFSFILMTSTVYAVGGRIAKSEDIKLLKRDLLSGKIKVSQTRLKMVRNTYGDAASVNSTDKRITLNYGDLKLVFDKNQYWKSWKYDTFKDPVYTDDADDLRFDLESQELVGNNITFTRITKNYGDPTDSMPAHNDGEMSTYYYGDIKLEFENVYVLRSWNGQNLAATSSDSDVEGVLTGGN